MTYKLFFNKIFNRDKIEFLKLLKRVLNMILILPFFIFSIPIVLIIRIVRPILLIRFQGLVSSRIGHLAGNTELYLCEKDEKINIPKYYNYIDIFYPRYSPICNNYLLKMWKREILILPRYLIHPINWINSKIPGGEIHIIGENTQHDRDVLNLLDKHPPHLKFTIEEEELGQNLLIKLGVKKFSDFICLFVRDKGYMPNIEDSYHDYRNCNISNYILIAEELTKRGYYVIRMGVKVTNSIVSNNSMIIDYATNGQRNEFMDIYLGAKCKFAISTSAGWDAIPTIFRKPVVFAPVQPLGYIFTFSNNFLSIIKHHYNLKTKKELTFSEIFENGLGFALHSKEFQDNNIVLLENTSEEICDLVKEFDDKLCGKWIEQNEDIKLKEKFLEIYTYYVNKNKKNYLHGEIKSTIGISYLRNNKNLLN